MNKAVEMVNKLLSEGLPKIVEQGIVIIILVVFVVFFINDRNKSAEREIQSSEALIEYLKADQDKAIRALEENNRQSKKQTEALNENNRLLRDLLTRL